MPSPALLLAFALTSLALVAVPGPSVLFVVGRSLALGRRAGLLTVLGNALGFVPLVAAVALGVGAVVAESVVLLGALRLAGAAYLVLLGVQAVRHRRDGGTGPDAGAARPRPRPRGARIVREGFLVGVTNPKTVVFLVAVLPQFVDHGAGSVTAQLVVLGLVFAAAALLGDSLWALAAGGARDWLGATPRRLAGLRAGGGVMMVGLGVATATSGHRA